MPLNLQQTTSRPVKRIVLTVLLVISLALTVVYAREGAAGPLHTVQHAIMGVTGRASGLTAGIAATVDGVGNATNDVLADQNSLTALREQNEQLRQLLANAEEYRQEAERLEQLLDMKRVSGITGPTARIIGRSTNPWDQTISIDLGSADGVHEGMTIMGATGVIGQVSTTFEHTSIVRLLTDPNSGAAVMIQSSREQGIVRGSMNGVLYLEGLSDDYIPAVGDVVITSGLGGSYQRGLIVGAIVSVNKTLNNPTGTVVVNPNDKASVLEEVIVVFSAPEVATTAGDSSDGQDASGSTSGITGESTSGSGSISTYTAPSTSTAPGTTTQNGGDDA